MFMKKLIIFLCAIVFSGTLFAQTGPGWGQQKSKVNFRDSTALQKNLNAVNTTITVFGQYDVRDYGAISDDGISDVTAIQML